MRLAIAVVLIAVTPLWAAEPIRVMLLDGQQAPSHPWQPTSPVLKKMLEDSRLFQVDEVSRR